MVDRASNTSSYAALDLPHRPEFERTPPPPGELVVERVLPLWQSLLDHGAVRRTMILVSLALIWELAGRWQGKPLMFPTFSAAATARWQGLTNEGLLWRGWAFAWRTLIAAELVFGVSSGAGGLGWYIFQARNELYTDRVFAGLAAVIIIGFVVENAVFRTAENATVNRWGMLR